MIVLAQLAGGPDTGPVGTPTATPSPQATEPAGVAAKPVCGAGHIMTGRDYEILNETVLRVGPDAKAAPILKPGVANDPDAAVNATVIDDTPLRERCRSNGWSYVGVMVPEYIRWMQGWVPTKTLKSVPVNAEGRRIYGVSDIEWQTGSGPYKSAIVKVANRIMAEDKRCDAIDTHSLLVEGDRDPKITLLCVGKRGTHDISFSAADATNGRRFTMSAVEPGENDSGTPISKVDAFSLCHDAITAQLQQPRSVDFHLSDTTFGTDGSRARFTIGFTAKNGFGNQIHSTAECVFDGATLTSASVIP